MDIEQANKTLLDVARRYAEITVGDIIVSTPYFINFAEQVYKQALVDANVAQETISDVLSRIKSQQTPLGAHGGKASPEEIKQDLTRMLSYIAKQGFVPKNPETIQKWMSTMHIGVDCSGYVFNIFREIENNQGISILNEFAWANPSTMKPSHAGAFIFDSPKLQTVVDAQDVQPLDILVFKDHTHVGVIVAKDGDLYLSDYSMARNLSFYNVKHVGKEITFTDAPTWTKKLKNNEVVIKRILL